MNEIAIQYSFNGSLNPTGIERQHRHIQSFRDYHTARKRSLTYHLGMDRRISRHAMAFQAGWKQSLRVGRYLCSKAPFK